MYEDSEILEPDAAAKHKVLTADTIAGTAGSSAATVGLSSGSHADSQLTSSASLSINPLSLAITPHSLEQEFWSSSRITQQLMTVDKTAFIMSTLNLYSGCNAASAIKSKHNRLLLQYLCVLYFLLSLVHQWYMHTRPRQYLQHRETILLVTRMIRGAWVSIMFAVCQVSDIFDYFVSKKLQQGISPHALTVQLMALPTLAILGQCLYYPLRFKLASVLQLLYVGASLYYAEGNSCVLQCTELASGTSFWCAAIQSFTEPVYAFFSLEGSSSSDMCMERSADHLLATWLISFGLVLPLYILYVKELSEKTRFLQHKCRRMHTSQDGGSLESLHQQMHVRLESRPLNLAPLLHAIAISILLVLGSGLADLMVHASKPTECHT